MSDLLRCEVKFLLSYDALAACTPVTWCSEDFVQQCKVVVCVIPDLRTCHDFITAACMDFLALFHAYCFMPRGVTRLLCRDGVSLFCVLFRDVVVGSCGLEYTLELTETGRRNRGGRGFTSDYVPNGACLSDHNRRVLVKLARCATLLYPYF